MLLRPATKPLAAYHDWDPVYPDVFADFVQRAAPLPDFLQFEHVGSTSIPGCGGKGIIDTLALYRTGHLEAVTDYLFGLGFGRQGPEFSKPWPLTRPMLLGTYLFRGRDFILYTHVVDASSDEVRRFRQFRALLTANPALVSEYCAVKKKIIADQVSDTDVYASRKSPFMHHALGDAHRLKS